MGRSQTRSDFISRIVIICLFIILFVIIMIPFYAVALSSFKPGESLVRYGLNLSLDFEIMSFDNFIFLFTGEHDYFVWFWNSMILTIVQVVLTLFVSAFVAYGFAAYHFKGKNFLFICVLLIMMVPFEILLVPLYSLINDLGMVNSYSAIILPV